MKIPTKDHAVTVAPANFLITAALAAVTKPGDLVLLPDPGFPTYELSCKFLGLEVFYYSLFNDSEAIFPNLEQLCKENSLRPKVVMVNNPSNPLGVAFDGKFLEAALQPLAKAGVNMIFDETYVNLVYEDTNPYIENIPATRIRSFSKEHCAPGLRIGYAIAEAQNAKVISDFVSLTISCAPKFIQLAVAEYLRSDERYIFNEHVKDTMRNRMSILVDNIPPDLLSYKPNSSFYALIKVSDGQLAFEYLMERNIAICPGYKFGSSTVNTIRVSLSGLEERFEHDVSMLGKALREM